jgi:hypothetical protein
MKEAIQQPDWFDRFWDEHKDKLPVYLRGQKKAARLILAGIMDAMGKQATTPEGVRTIIAFARIASIVKGTRGVMDSPDPSPDQVADAVERLVQRMVKS